MQIHQEAQDRVRTYQSSVAKFLETLEKVENQKVYRRLGYASLWSYCTLCLKVSESETYRFIAVMRKSTDVPELKAAVNLGELSLPTAARIAPLLNAQNKSEWIKDAKDLTTRELERKIVALNPQTISRERITPKTTDISELRLPVKDGTLKNLERAKDILSQRLQKAATTEETISMALAEYIQRHCPVEKAKRVTQRTSLSALKVKAPNATKPESHKVANTSPIVLSNTIESPNLPPKNNLTHTATHTPVPAQVRHQVALRDGGQCTITLPSGVRCANKRHLEMHHIVHRADGGANTLPNLTTLCFSHHKYQHTI